MGNARIVAVKRIPTIGRRTEEPAAARFLRRQRELQAAASAVVLPFKRPAEKTRS